MTTVTIQLASTKVQGKYYGSFYPLRNGRQRVDPEKAGPGVTVDDNGVAQVEFGDMVDSPHKAAYAVLVYAARYAANVQAAYNRELKFRFLTTSDLVVKQMSGEWDTEDPALADMQKSVQMYSRKKIKASLRKV